MMGERTVMQEALFYEFSLERHVPSDHLQRSIDRFVDLSGLRAHLQPFYSKRYERPLLPESGSVIEITRGLTGRGGCDGGWRQASS